MSEGTHKSIWPTKELDVSDIKLQTYSREPLPVVDVREVHAIYEGQRVSLPLVLSCQGNGPTLLGGNWLGSIRLDWGRIHYIPSTGLQDKYKEVFSEKLEGEKPKLRLILKPLLFFVRPAHYHML